MEGRYYVFTPGSWSRCWARRRAACSAARYGITRGGNFEGKSIPNLIGPAPT